MLKPLLFVPLLTCFFIMNCSFFAFSQDSGFIRQYAEGLDLLGHFVVETTEGYEIPCQYSDSTTAWMNTDTTAFPFQHQTSANHPSYQGGQVIDTLATGGFSITLWVSKTDLNEQQLWYYEAEPFYSPSDNARVDIQTSADTGACLLTYQKRNATFPRAIRLSSEGEEVCHTIYSPVQNFNGTESTTVADQNTTYKINRSVSPSQESTAYWITKYSDQSFQYSVYYSSYSYGPFIPTSDGGLVLAETRLGQTGNIHIKKFDGSGSLEWVRTYPFIPNINSIQVAKNGEYLLTGSLDNQLWLMKTGTGLAYPSPDHAVTQIILPGGSSAAPNGHLPSLIEHQNLNPNKWDYKISEPTQSPKYKTERYAFLWKTNKVTLVGKPHLAQDYARQIYRELYLARFKTETGTIMVVNYHALFIKQANSQHVF